MTTGPSKFSSRARKQQEYIKSPGNQFDAALLSMKVAAQSPFRRNARRLLLRREKRVTDSVFQTLLSEVNQELAGLLQDVRTMSNGGLLGDTQSPPIGELLMRAVRCAAKQYRLQAELSNLVLTDELTGLYNRRGFVAIAERQLKVGRRSGRGMLLFFIDVDGLKQINDSFGHSEGDRALKHAAKALEKTFRDSDVIARMGGDEFVVLAIEASDFSEGTIRARLCKYLKAIASRESRYLISLSLGAARFDPHSNSSLGDLIIQADRAMYKRKRHPEALSTSEYQQSPLTF
jgi:diguanylate cyclase (GGDEF)-like protein